MNITKTINFNVKQQQVNARNVLQQKHTIPVTITKLYTDVDGVVIDKSLAPAVLQTRFPVFVLGEFDRQGGYSVGKKAIAPDPGTYYLQTFINGLGATSYSITGQNGLNTIQGYLKPGDVVIVYTDSIAIPTTYVFFIISSEPVSMSSILSNSATSQRDKRLGKLVVYGINMVASDDSQFSEDLHFTRTDNIGNYGDNQIQPLGIYRSIMDKQANVVRLKVAFDITQFLGINFYMLYAADSVRLELLLIKI